MPNPLPFIDLRFVFVKQRARAVRYQHAVKGFAIVERVVDFRERNSNGKRSPNGIPLLQDVEIVGPTGPRFEKRAAKNDGDVVHGPLLTGHLKDFQVVRNCAVPYHVDRKGKSLDGRIFFESLLCDLPDGLRRKPFAFVMHAKQHA
jgi:hypothetical protein